MSKELSELVLHEGKMRLKEAPRMSINTTQVGDALEVRVPEGETDEYSLPRAINQLIPDRNPAYARANAYFDESSQAPARKENGCTIHSVKLYHLVFE